MIAISATPGSSGQARLAELDEPAAFEHELLGAASRSSMDTARGLLDYLAVINNLLTRPAECAAARVVLQLHRQTSPDGPSPRRNDSPGMSGACS